MRYFGTARHACTHTPFFSTGIEISRRSLFLDFVSPPRANRAVPGEGAGSRESPLLLRTCGARPGSGGGGGFISKKRFFPSNITQIITCRNSTDFSGRSATKDGLFPPTEERQRFWSCWSSTLHRSFYCSVPSQCKIPQIHPF